MRMTKRQQKLISEIIDSFAKEYSWEDMKQACVAIAMVCIMKQLKQEKTQCPPVTSTE